MKIINLTLVITLFVNICYSQSYTHYNKGDTLFVVALDGVNLRSSAGVDGKIIRKLNNGDTIVIQKTIEPKADTSFGFQGHWVKISPINNDESGFVFDAFISKYPVINDLMNIYDRKEKFSDLMTDNINGSLLQYANRVFTSNLDTVVYLNGPRTMEIIRLTNGVQFIKHLDWEVHNYELELDNPRISEVYYLVYNLIKYCPPAFEVMKEFRSFPEFSGEPFPQKPTICLNEGHCFFILARKGTTLFSITSRFNP